MRGTSRVELDAIDDEQLIREVDTESEHFKSLKRYMERTKCCPPIELRPNGEGFTLIDGAHRTMAAHILGWKDIPALVRTDIQDEVHAKEEALATFNKVPAKPMDLARTLSAIKESRSYSLDELADATGMSRAQVDARLRIKNLTGQCAKLVDSGAIPLETAKYLAKLQKHGVDPNTKPELLKRCASESASEVVGEIKKMIKGAKPTRRFKGRKKADLVEFFLAIEKNPDFSEEFKKGILYSLGEDLNG